MQISKDGLGLIKHYEGLYLTAYLCPAKVWTIGWGHTKTAERGMRITREQAEQLLAEDMRPREKQVLDLCKIKPNQKQFDALCSLAFNIGTPALNGSTLMRKWDAGDAKGAADQFLVWNKAGGKVLKGLQRRRKAEQLVFLGADAAYAIKEAEKI